ncbi:unnamed protein product, partial [marine sediment metagenome]
PHERVGREYGKDVEPIYPGDIGCYDLAYNPPLEAVDVQICMGGSFGFSILPVGFRGTLSNMMRLGLLYLGRFCSQN